MDPVFWGVAYVTDTAWGAVSDTTLRSVGYSGRRHEVRVSIGSRSDAKMVDDPMLACTSDRPVGLGGALRFACEFTNDRDEIVRQLAWLSVVDDSRYQRREPAANP